VNARGMVGSEVNTTCVGLARTIYIRCIYGIFGREIIKYMVSYTVYKYGSGQPYTCAMSLMGRNVQHLCSACLAASSCV